MKKNVLIVVLALLVVGGGGFIAGDKLGKKNSTPETTVESTTAEAVNAEVVPEATEQVAVAPATNAPEAGEQVAEAPATKDPAPVTEKVVVDEKIVYVTEKKVEPKVDTVKPTEKVTVAVKPAVKVTEAVTKVNKPDTPVASTKNSAEKISREKAKSIALNHAGVKEADVREFEIELDYEKGVHVYEVSFESGKYDYEYYIDAVTGAIKFSEKEPENEVKVNKAEKKVETTKNSAEKITREKAKSVALDHAGVKEADVRGLEVELDYDKGVHVYEVNFESGRYEYDYDIDAYSGAVKFSKKGFDD